MSLNPLETVHIGIVGPSWWVNYWHLPAIENHPDAEITAICGANARDAAEVKNKYGEAARYYTDLGTMLETELLDGIIVCTPNDLHYPCSMAALHKGIHVTCEKPVAMTAAQAREMADMAHSRGLLGMTNFPYRDNPAAVRARELVAEGYLGKPLHISGAYHGGFGLFRAPGWRGLRDRSGAGILGDLGSHLIDLARYISGEEFSAVCGHSMTAVWGEDKSALPHLVRTGAPEAGPRNDDSCAFLAEFASGAQGIFHTSWLAYQGAARQHQELEIYGTNGRLHFLSTHAGTLLRGLKEGATRWDVIPVEGTTIPDPAQEEEEDYFRPGRLDATNSTYRWIEAIRTGAEWISPSFEDGWRAQQVIDAVIQASAERKWVEVGPNPTAGQE